MRVLQGAGIKIVAYAIFYFLFIYLFFFTLNNFLIIHTLSSSAGKLKVVVTVQ